VRHALEEAHVFTALVTKAHKVKSSVTLSEFLKPFQSKAANLRFPALLAAVNEKLDPKIDFSGSYKSLQRARNCLEHRNGIIGAEDTYGGDRFNFSVPRVKLFYMRDGTEVEIEKGHVVNPGDGQSHAQVLMKLEERKRSVALGERLTFALDEFNEIAFACHYLGQQLSSKLPKPKISQAKDVGVPK
jgi:hypothetical protein